jgi:hypothetical protein
VDGVESALKRYSLVYGSGSVAFDHQEHMLVKLADVRDACTNKNFVRDWQADSRRRIVRIEQVGFDPSGADSNITCNLWGGWPTTPKQGNCDRLLQLLSLLCSEEDDPKALFEWVVKWLAYPIQNPGAKMKTAIVMHGPQGAGKNLFFEAYMSIFGEYGRVIDQSSVEDKFNDWASRKLFLIADEVVARQELYHMKNKLKGLITGDHIRINPKNVTPHDERNHVNLVFLSNETQPVVLERDDRRYCVIWTPPKEEKEFYAEVRREVREGGVAALHWYLLNEVDLTGFENGTLPPDTRAKRELIELSMDSTERFWNEWISGRLDPVPVVPCLSRDFYVMYRIWANQTGVAWHHWHRIEPATNPLVPESLSAIHRQLDQLPLGPRIGRQGAVFESGQVNFIQQIPVQRCYPAFAYLAPHFGVELFFFFRRCPDHAIAPVVSLQYHGLGFVRQEHEVDVVSLVVWRDVFRVDADVVASDQALELVFHVVQLLPRHYLVGNQEQFAAGPVVEFVFDAGLIDNPAVFAEDRHIRFEKQVFASPLRAVHDDGGFHLGAGVLDRVSQPFHHPLEQRFWVIFFRAQQAQQLQQSVAVSLFWRGRPAAPQIAGDV